MFERVNGRSGNGGGWQQGVWQRGVWIIACVRCSETGKRAEL